MKFVSDLTTEECQDPKFVRQLIKQIYEVVFDKLDFTGEYTEEQCQVVREQLFRQALQNTRARTGLDANCKLHNWWHD